MTISLSALMKQRGDTAANWTAANPTLLANELAYETDTQKWKVGDGSTAWTSLGYTPWSQISSYPIVNADIAAGAEIAVSKLADGDARQLLQTDAAGTGVEWASNIDVPGTLDVTGAATFDNNVTIEGDLQVNGTETIINTQTLDVEDKNIVIGKVTTPSDVTADGGGITLKGATDKTINWVNATDAWTSSERFDFPAGTEGAPSIILNGDVNSGLYQPGADEVAISTGGSARLYIAADGDVGVGTTSPGFKCQVDSPIALSGSGNDYYFVAGNTSSASRRAVALGVDGVGGNAVIAGYNTFSPGLGTLIVDGSDVRLRTGGTERARIDSSGRLGIGTSSPSSNLEVSDNQPSLRLNTTTAGYTGLIWSTNGTNDGGIYYYGTGDRMEFYTGDTGGSPEMVITAAGNVGIGTTSPNNLLSLAAASGGAYTEVAASGYTLGTNSIYYGQESTGDFVLYNRGNNHLQLGTNNTERVRIDNLGRLLVGTSTTSRTTRLSVTGNSAGASNEHGIVDFQFSGTAPGNGWALGYLNFADTSTGNAARIGAERDGGTWTSGTSMPGRLVFSTSADGASSPTERLRIDNSGYLIGGGSTDTNPSANNAQNIYAIGEGRARFSADLAAPLDVNRKGNDGVVVNIRQDGTSEGNISVSGTTVSYNGAHLSRWSQLPGGAERTEILRGSVLSSIDEMCEWGEEDNEQLNRMKVSDVEGDKNVSGVFQSWDDDDDTYTNDFYCAMTGDFVIRIAQGVTVERGDLLMSAGDGTAKPQDDDIIRSKTIAKVTSTNVSCTYDDGSYCVPCVLMAC